MLLGNQIDARSKGSYGGITESRVLVAIVSSGVDLLIGSIANMLKVDDWAANGFEWDEEGWLIGSKPTVVQSHDKGITVEKFARINSIDPENIVSLEIPDPTFQ